MKSSYVDNNYENVFKTLCFQIKPSRIVEFGILEGYSLHAMIQSSAKTTKIDACDIFDEFPYNAAVYEQVKQNFSEYENVEVKKANFFGYEANYENGQIDILHIDIANDGDTYKHALDNYMEKISIGGVCVLEGGSKERDNVWWMSKFSKPSIVEVISSKKYTEKYNIQVLEDYPSLTLISHK